MGYPKGNEGGIIVLSSRSAIELQEGKSPYSDGTYPCSNYGCYYNHERRCLYNVARLQIRIGRACYPELRQDEIEAELDYLDGCM